MTLPLESQSNISHTPLRKKQILIKCPNDF
jgi:hypothetical protein